MEQIRFEYTWVSNIKYIDMGVFTSGVPSCASSGFAKVKVNLA